MGLSKLSMLALAGFAFAELPPVHITGQKFFYKNGTQFFMKGIAYQEEAAPSGGTTEKESNYEDPLANPKNCKRDVPLLKELGVNTIRTYAINPTKDHDECMRLLDDAGIYVISDLSEPKTSIKRDAPQWNTVLYKRYTDVVDELAKYSNVIGFFAGNEVSDAANNTEASAYVKAAVRDTKLHIQNQIENKKISRPLGVGYATNDHEKVRDALAEYFNCGPKEEAIDFWGYNIYSWCGESDMKKSGFDDWVKYYEDYSVPVFFAEYGCNAPGGAEGRKFEDTEALFSDAMTHVFSGGLVYMFHQEANDYGVVEIKGGEATKMKNFQALKKAHAKVDPQGVDEDDYTPNTNKSQTCPEVGEVWKAHANLPPTPDPELCECAAAASKCVLKPKATEKDAGKIIGYICGEDSKACKEAIGGNPEKGEWTVGSTCPPKQQADILLGVYYQNQDEADTACDHKGMAVVQEAKDPGQCKDKLESAKTQMDKSNSAAASGNSEDEEDFGITSTPIARLFSLGDMAVGLYMVAAVGAGAAMVVF